jgi:hypothetical protein
MLALAPAALAQSTPPPKGQLTAQAVQLDVPATVTLTGSGAADLLLTLESAATVTVSARSLEQSGALDTTLEVLDSTSTRLSFNDDHGTTSSDFAPYDSLVQDLSLNPGSYIVRVSTFSGAGEGAVEVLVSAGGATAQTGGGETEVIAGSVAQNATYTHQFEGAANETVTITVRATDGMFDPSVQLLGAGGKLLIENDDHATSDSNLTALDSRISDYTLAQAGTYTIAVNGFAGAAGQFELTIERGGGSSASTSTSTTMTGGDIDVVEGAVRQDETFTYTLEGTAGDVYVFTAIGTDESFDPRLVLYDTEDVAFASNDDHGSTDETLEIYDSRLGNVILPVDGSYYLDVSGYQGAPGSFELTVERIATGAPVGAGTEEVVSGSIQQGGTFVHGFSAQAGDYVTIVVRAVSEEFDPVVGLFDNSDNLLAANDDNSEFHVRRLGFLDSKISNYAITESGEYEIEVISYGDGAGSFAVTITTVR